MKTCCVTCFIALAMFVALESPRAYAQADVAPDYYPIGSDPEPQPQPKTSAPDDLSKVHYEGNFVLPYSVQCYRGSLYPGKYSISVDSEGAVVWVTLNRKGHRLRIEGTRQRQERNRSRNVLVVERKGATRQLSVIQLATWNLVFRSVSSLPHPAGGNSRNLQELPLVLADSRE